MTGDNEPEGTSRPSGEGAQMDHVTDQDLSARSKRLDAALAKRRIGGENGDRKEKEGIAGFATAMKLSSEFIAAIVVGAFIGWLIDFFAGSSPFGLIIFLILGFCAGVLSVLRSAGLVAERDRDQQSGS